MYMMHLTKSKLARLEAKIQQAFDALLQTARPRRRIAKLPHRKLQHRSFSADVSWPFIK